MLKEDEIDGFNEKILEPLEAIRTQMEQYQKAQDELQLKILNDEIANQPLRKKLTFIDEAIQEASVILQVRQDPIPLRILTNNDRVFVELHQWCQRFAYLPTIIERVDLFEVPVMFIFGGKDSIVAENVLRPMTTTVFDLSEE